MLKFKTARDGIQTGIFIVNFEHVIAGWAAIYFPYAQDIFGTLMKDNIFVMMQFHVIIYQMETESSLWNLLT